MPVTSIRNKDPKESGDSFPADVCRNGCKAAADELAQEGQDAERCAHESWEETNTWRDRLTLRWWQGLRCADCGEGLDSVELGGPPLDPYEGEQGNCLHGGQAEDFLSEEGQRALTCDQGVICTDDSPCAAHARSAFKPGDKVRRISNRDAMTIEWGPLTAYVVSDATGDSVIVNADLIEPIPPADPRVDVAQSIMLPMIADAELRVAVARDVLAALDAMEES